VMTLQLSLIRCSTATVSSPPERQVQKGVSLTNPLEHAFFQSFPHVLTSGLTLVLPEHGPSSLTLLIKKGSDSRTFDPRFFLTSPDYFSSPLYE